MPEQLFFDFSEAKPVVIPEKVQQATARRRQQLRRAVIRWLQAEWQPAGLALDVPTRVSKIRADVAGFRSRLTSNAGKPGPTSLLKPAQTVVVLCLANRQDCWPDCLQPDALIGQLKLLRQQMAALETQIRQEEPGLRSGDALFEEFAEWRYERSRNPDYHQLSRSIATLEDTLYNGTRFERIAAGVLASQLYLAVPEGLVKPDELAEPWGLLEIAEDLSITVIKPAPEHKPPLENQMHLIQNIAAAATDAVCRQAGLAFHKDGTPYFTTVPRCHTKEKPLRLSDFA